MSSNQSARAWRGVPPGLRAGNISAIYLFILMFIAFSLWVPQTFLTWGVWRSVLDTQSLTALAAIAIVMPLAAGVINLAVGAEIGFASILVAALIQKLELSPSAAVPLAVLAGGLIGVITGLLVVRAKIDSLIATLGTSSVLAAGTAWISSSQQIVELGEGFQKLATTRVLGLTSTTWLMLLVATGMWYFLECTPAGRRVYATGGNRRAAEFAGVQASAVIVTSFVVCGAIAALAGILVSARTGTGDPTTGPGFLLPAFAAAMLGSTQIKRGRYNVVGTLIAVYVLATGIKGLQLAGAPVWIPDLFNGLALLIAVAVTARQRVKKRGSAVAGPSRTPGEPSPEASTVPTSGDPVKA
jgi:ribose transport system permease protein